MDTMERPRHVADSDLTLGQRVLQSILNVEKADLLIATLHLVVTSLAVFGLVSGAGGGGH